MFTYRIKQKNGAASLMAKTAPFLVSYGVPERIRTSDLRFRKPLLYPAELRRHCVYTPHYKKNHAIWQMKGLGENSPSPRFFPI